MVPFERRELRHVNDGLTASARDEEVIVTESGVRPSPRDKSLAPPSTGWLAWHGDQACDPSGDRGLPVSAALRLRPPRLDDETAFRAGHQVVAAEGFTLGLGLEPAMPWSTYLKILHEHRTGMNLPAGLVPQTLLVADVGGEIVGRTSIRHELNETLEREGGPYWLLRPSPAPAARSRNRDPPAEPYRGQGQRGRAGTGDLRRRQHWLDISHRKVRRPAGFRRQHRTSNAPVLVRLNHRQPRQRRARGR